MISTNVIAEGGKLNIAKATTANKSCLLDMGTYCRWFLLKWLELSADQLPTYSIKCPLRRKAIMLFLDMHGECSGGIKGFMLTTAQIYFFELILDNTWVIEPARQTALEIIIVLP